jgi:hypothetical protein
MIKMIFLSTRYSQLLSMRIYKLNSESIFEERLSKKKVEDKKLLKKPTYVKELDNSFEKNEIIYGKITKRSPEIISFSHGIAENRIQGILKKGEEMKKKYLS